MAADTVWLTLLENDDGSTTALGVPLATALWLDKKGFAKLYRRHVYGAGRRVASRWAEKQIAERARQYIAVTNQAGW